MAKTAITFTSGLSEVFEDAVPTIDWENRVVWLTGVTGLVVGDDIPFAQIQTVHVDFTEETNGAEEERKSS